MADFVSRTVPGPRTASVSQEEARKALVEHPEFKRRKAELVEIKDVDGRWVATIKEAAPPAFLDDEAPSDPAEDSKDEAPSVDDDDSSEESEDKDSESDEKPGEDKGEKAEVDINQVFDLVKQIAVKVGVPIEGAEEGLPGEEGLPVPPPDAPVPPPAAPAGGPPAPKAGPGRPPGAKKTRPGENIPGTGVTPLGSPAFSNVAANNPFPEFIGKVASFDVWDHADDSVKLGEAKAELDELVNPHGYQVEQVKRVEKDGQPAIAARISRRRRK